MRPKGTIPHKFSHLFLHIKKESEQERRRRTKSLKETMQRKRLKTLMLSISVAAVLGAAPIPALAEEKEAATEAVTEKQTEAPQTEAPQTEVPQTEAPQTDPPQTEAPQTEPPQTEAQTERQTEAPQTEPQTQPQTEAKKETEKATEKATERATEKKTEKATEKAKEKETQKATQKATEKETEKKETEREKKSAFSVNPSQYPAMDINEATKVIYQYLRKEMQLNHAAASGVLANIQCESVFNPLALGDGGTSYGICQWHNGRFRALISFCNSKDLDYNTLEGQLAYLQHELTNSYPGVLSYIEGVEDTKQGAYDAAYYWCMHFEIPNDTVNRSIQRGNLAKEYYDKDFEISSEAQERLDRIIQIVEDSNKESKKEIITKSGAATKKKAVQKTTEKETEVEK